jgi:hypothetical protein
VPGYATPRFAYMQRSRELGYYGRHEWSAEPARMLQPAVTDALDRSARFAAVVAAPSPAVADLRLDLGHVQEVLDQRVRPLDRAVDDLDLFVAREVRLVPGVVEQYTDAELDRVQRVTEVVRHDPKHLVATTQRAAELDAIRAVLDDEADAAALGINTWEARYDAAGEPVLDGRPPQLDAVGWFTWATWYWYVTAERTSFVPPEAVVGGVVAALTIAYAVVAPAAGLGLEAILSSVLVASGVFACTFAFFALGWIGGGAGGRRRRTEHQPHRRHRAEQGNRPLSCRGHCRSSVTSIGQRPHSS